ncbi:hypothetical protein VKT23_018228 [Stygiomarasmius scandens]|uniref:Uncharacterized protein n=1 Tax=Marasmiellus scandens TaxID=2682957 RepID=A0ABR1IPR2_9AGAR
MQVGGTKLGVFVIVSSPKGKYLSNTTISLQDPKPSISLRATSTLQSCVMDLASLLEQPPPPHEATSACTLESQASMAKAWNIGTQWLVWKSTEESISSQNIRNVLQEFTRHITCADCIRSRDQRINQVTRQWSALSPPATPSVKVESES